MIPAPFQHTINTPYLVGPVHCYSLERDGEIVLFDTGPPTPEAKQYLSEHIDLTRLRHVVITHTHIDHYGLAHWLEDTTKATVYLPYRDCLKITHHEQRMEAMYCLLLELGFENKYIEDLRTVFNSGVLFPSLPKQYKIAEEEVEKTLGIKILNCPGHSQSDLVYTAGGWAVTGDTLLKGIFQSPLLDVDLLTGKRFGNYLAYCETIQKLASLGDVIVLPGHRKRIDSAQDSVLFYISKMLQRVEQLLPYKDEENVSKIITSLFGESFTNIFHVYLKASEIVFMQDFLQNPEKLKKALTEIDLFDRVDDQYSYVTGGKLK